MIGAFVLLGRGFLLSFGKHALEVEAVDCSEDQGSNDTDDYNCNDSPPELLLRTLSISVALALPAAA